MTRAARTVLRRSPSLSIEGFDDFSAAFIFQESPPRAYRVDALSWLVLETCDGRTQDELIEDIAKGFGRGRDVQQPMDAAIRELKERGLIVEGPVLQTN